MNNGGRPITVHTSRGLPLPISVFTIPYTITLTPTFDQRCQYNTQTSENCDPVP